MMGAQGGAALAARLALPPTHACLRFMVSYGFEALSRCHSQRCTCRPGEQETDVVSDFGT